MIATLANHPLVIAASASFLAGVCGYIIFRFWALPVARYRRIKNRIARALEATDGAQQSAVPKDAAHQKKLRSLSVTLSETFNTQLPPWYRISLGGKKEQPLEAAKQLMALAGTKDPKTAAQKHAKIRKLLSL